ncbi:phage tail domain-containing protein [Ligilactobacillus sp. LYQ135]
MSLNEYWLKAKVCNQDEININTTTPDLHFVKLTTQSAFTNSYQSITRVNGRIYTTSQFDKTTVNLKFLIRFNDWKDFDLAKHDIYRFFMTKEIIRIRCNTAPNKVYYYRAIFFQIAPTKVGSARTVFTNPSGLAYSICNSDEISNLDKGSEWSYGMNISNNYPLQYHFSNTNNFTIYNSLNIGILLFAE